MTTLFELIQSKFSLNWRFSCQREVPFSLEFSTQYPEFPPQKSGISKKQGDSWSKSQLVEISNSHWRLSSHALNGLYAIWDIRFFEDTRAFECWGRITNEGNTTIKNIVGCNSWDVNLPLEQEFGQPWVRSVNGVRFLPNCYPPHDFAVVDRQLIHTLQMYIPFVLTGLEDGRSSGENLPCVIVTNEKQTYGLASFFEWSGLWKIYLKPSGETPEDNNGFSSLHMKVGYTGLQLDLKPGQSLPLARVLMSFFDGNLEDGGNSLRRHIRQHITPRLAGKEVLPPTSFNHWFAFKRNFTDKLLKQAVDSSASAGLEYFCVDAGWFKGNFRQGIGNWTEVNKNCFPNGIEPFSRYIGQKGMKFGLWFEPEWAHKDSDLFQRHPEWFWISPKDTSYKTSSNYMFFLPDYHLMNFGLKEVRQWWIERICFVYEKWHVRWIRWDFNQMPRPNWENGVPAGEIGWRQIHHINGLYNILDEILKACPELFIEQSAGGGHRIDLGTIRRAHTFWMNDLTTNTDMIRFFQHGLNTVLPGNYANTNICQERHNFTDYDFLSHSAGGLGYSGKLWEASPEDFKRFSNAVSNFKTFRHLLLGDYQHLSGQSLKFDDYTQVVFSDNGQSLKMEFNLGRYGGYKIESAGS